TNRVDRVVGLGRDHVFHTHSASSPSDNRPSRVPPKLRFAESRIGGAWLPGRGYLPGGVTGAGDRMADCSAPGRTGRVDTGSAGAGRAGTDRGTGLVAGSRRHRATAPRPAERTTRSLRRRRAAR